MMHVKNMIFTNHELLQPKLNDTLNKISNQKIISRIWDHDYTVWKNRPHEITNRLGWLTINQHMLKNLPKINERILNIRKADFNQALLLGMGGSSLAPEVFRTTYGVSRNHLDLSVLDSTDPGAVWAHIKTLDPKRTLFIVSTKSGGTVETLSFFKVFYNWIADQLKTDHPGNHFIAITDPDSQLEQLTEKYGFRDCFLNDPMIGGRFSALSYFGLVPAALMGVDLQKLLDCSRSLCCSKRSCINPFENEGIMLGVVLGEWTKAGRDKVTFVISPELANFGNWVEQLIAESTGKDENGILPVVNELLGQPKDYGNDRLFVHLKLKGDQSQKSRLADLIKAGHPLVSIELNDVYDLGAQFFLWEFATAVACVILKINPFDQPNVESAKVLAREMITNYQKKGFLPQPENSPMKTHILNKFLARANPGDYIALQAYLQPKTEISKCLEVFRQQLRDRSGLAVTLGFGPRFLHSTGQLHKGDRGNGLFIQITAPDAKDVDIPDEPDQKGSSITFGILKNAQTLGDFQALKKAGRRVIRFHLENQEPEGLDQLLSLL